jgi:hypothetical protein
MSYGAATEQAFQLFEHARELAWSRIKCDMRANTEISIDLPFGYEILYGIAYGKSLAKLGMTAVDTAPVISANTQAILDGLRKQALNVRVSEELPHPYLPAKDLFPAPILTYKDKRPALPNFAELKRQQEEDIAFLAEQAALDLNPLARQVLVSQSYCNLGARSSAMWVPYKFPGRSVSRQQDCCARPCVDIGDVARGAPTIVNDCCKSWYAKMLTNVDAIAEFRVACIRRLLSNAFSTLCGSLSLSGSG